MDTRALKGRALAALISGLGLLGIVIFLTASGKTPILLIILTVLLTGYGLRGLWRLRKV